MDRVRTEGCASLEDLTSILIVLGWLFNHGVCGSFGSIVAVAVAATLNFLFSNSTPPLPPTFETRQCQIRMSIRRIQFQDGFQNVACLTPQATFFKRSCLGKEISYTSFFVLIHWTALVVFATSSPSLVVWPIFVRIIIVSIFVVRFLTSSRYSLLDGGWF